MYRGLTNLNLHCQRSGVEIDIIVISLMEEGRQAGRICVRLTWIPGLVYVDLFELGLQLCGNGVYFCRGFPFHETSPSTSKVLPEAAHESGAFCGQVLYKRIL